MILIDILLPFEVKDHLPQLDDRGLQLQYLNLSYLESFLSYDVVAESISIYGLRTFLALWAVWSAMGRLRTALGFSDRSSIYLLEAIQVLHHALLVDLRLVLNFLCTRSVSKCTERLVLVLWMWRDGDNHAGLRVATKGVRQDPRQLRLPVRYM